MFLCGLTFRSGVTSFGSVECWGLQSWALPNLVYTQLATTQPSTDLMCALAQGGVIYCAKKNNLPSIYNGPCVQVVLCWSLCCDVFGLPVFCRRRLSVLRDARWERVMLDSRFAFDYLFCSFSMLIADVILADGNQPASYGVLTFPDMVATQVRVVPCA